MSKPSRPTGRVHTVALGAAVALPLLLGALVWAGPVVGHKHAFWKDPPLGGRAARRQRLLEKIPGDPSALVNVRYEHLPATHDMTMLGKAALPALHRGLTHNVKPGVRQRIAWVLTDLANHQSRAVLRAALKDWNNAVRRQAVQGLAAIGDRGAAKLFWQRYDDPEESDSVKHQALRALGRVGAVGAAPRLLKILADPKDTLAVDTRRAALSALWDLRHQLKRTQLRRALRLALSAKASTLNTFGAAAVAELRDDAPALRKALFKRLWDADANVRNLAVYALGEVGHKSAIKPLRKRIRTARSARLLNNIAFALRKLGDGRVMALLGDLLRHRLAVIRLNAAYVLGDIRDPAALPLLVKALGDPSDYVRASAISAMARLGSLKAVYALRPLLKSKKLSLRVEALFALNRLTKGRYNQHIVRTLLHHKKPRLARAAAYELAKRGDVRAIRPLSFCHARHRCSSSALARALGRLRTVQATPPLLAAYTRTVTSDASSANQLLRALGRRKLLSGHQSLLRSQLSASKWQPRRRRALLRFLGRLQDRRARSAYWGLFKSRDRLTQLNAAYALANQGYVHGRRRLINALTQAAPRVKRGAADLLRSLTHTGSRAQVKVALRKALKGHGPHTRLAAAYALTGWDLAAGLKILIAGLQSPNRRVRHEAGYYLMRREMRPHRAAVAKALTAAKSTALRGTLRRVLRRLTPGTLHKVSHWVTL